MVGRLRRTSPARSCIEKVTAVENVVYVEIETVAVVGFQRTESPVAVSVAQVAFGCQIGVGVGRVVEIAANHHHRLRLRCVQAVGFGAQTHCAVCSSSENARHGLNASVLAMSAPYTSVCQT